jgi:putative transposase
MAKTFTWGHHDGLRGCGAAMDELGCRGRQDIGRALQKFASVHANLHNHFRLERHLTDRLTHRETRPTLLADWQSLAT